MNNMKLYPAMRYQLIYLAETFALMFGIAAALFIVSQVGITVAGITVDSMLWNVGTFMLFALFVVGIGGVREDLRLMIQHGIGRRTTYVSTLLSDIVAGAGFGLILELLNVISRAVPAFPFSGLVFPVEHFLASWLLHIGAFLFARQLGVMISLLYYRMNKMQAIVFSVTAGALFLLGLPRTFIGRGEEWFEALILTMVESALVIPPTLRLSAFVICAAVIVANFFLIRNATIRESQG